MKGVGHVYAQDEDDAHAGAEGSNAAMTSKGVPDGVGVLSIGTTVGLLRDGIDEARAFIFPRRKQRRKQRT